MKSDAGAHSLLFDLWAKTDPWHPLPCHLVDVGNVAWQLVQNGPFSGTVTRFHNATGCPSADTPAWLAYLAALHDLGKCHPEFQAKGGPEMVLPLEVAGLDCHQTSTRFRHEAVSASWLLAYLMNTLDWDRASAQTVAGATRGHHGNFDAEAPGESLDRVRQWEPLRSALEREIHAVFQPLPWKAQFTDNSAAGLLLAGLIVLSDWIASNAELFDMKWQGEPLEEYAAEGRWQAQRAVQRLGLNVNPACPQSSNFYEVWPRIQQMRPVQAICQKAVESGLSPGLTIIEAPMGEGKTEAAFFLASQWIADGHAGGMYLALPTAATSNQMFQRLKDFWSQHDPEAADGVQLVHGSSWLLDRATPEEAPELSDESDPDAGERALDWFRPRKRSLLATHGVGTVDQAEMSVLNVKHGFLRLYGLAHKVLIIDEVHAYDAYQTEIIKRLLGWCHALSLPVILLSATLPQRRKAILMHAYAPVVELPDDASGTAAPYPLITHADRQGRLTLLPVPSSGRGVNVRLQLHAGLLQDPPATARLVADRVTADGGCHVVIANTVDAAQAIYRELEEILPQDGTDAVHIRMFHARFPLAQRQKIEHDVLMLFDKRSVPGPDNLAPTLRPARAVLVATQVVEQSLDLDFDEMYSQIAPIDLLLQRSGRLHRHDRPNRPTGNRQALHVMLPEADRLDFGPTGNVYHPYILIRTLWQLQKSIGWQLPGQMRELVERVYGDADLGGLSNQELLSLRKDWLDLEERDEATARPYLIPEPYARGFKLARMSGGAFDEDDGDARSYFTARTRLGDDSVRMAVLEGDDHQHLLALDRAPPKDRLEAIYLRTVNLPVWWFKDAQPLDGFEPPQKGPVWLTGTRVLRLKSGRWLGKTQRGQRFAIEAHSVYGMMRYDEGA